MKQFLEKVKEKFKTFKERIKRGVYATFREEINKFVGVTDRSMNFGFQDMHEYKRPIIVKSMSLQPETLTFAVQIDEREYSSGFGDTVSQKIERAKQEMARQIVEGDFIEVETAPLISSQFYGRHEIRASLVVCKKR